MVAIKRLSTVDADFTAKMDALLAFEAAADEGIERTVANILADVKQRGDAAVVDYTNKFDRLTATSMADLELSKAEMQKALDGLPADRRSALEAAAGRIRAYHERQKMEGWSYTEADGTMLGQMITPLDRVGLYVPGGKAAYPSSVLMNAIPAKVAGVKELIMVVPTPGGEHNQLVLAAACLAGVDRVFTMGGAQAVGALAYGTQTVPQVDKIVGQRADRLGTAHGEYAIDAGQAGSGQHQLVVLATWRRDDHDQLLDAGDLGRNRVHQHRRRIGGLAARHVEADTVERGDHLAEHGAIGLGVGPAFHLLPLVVGPDTAGSGLQCATPVSRQAVQSLLHFGFGQLQVSHRGGRQAVELVGVVHNSGIATLLHVGQDVGNSTFDTLIRCRLEGKQRIHFCREIGVDR
jgi:hypothetical protein